VVAVDSGQIEQRSSDLDPKAVDARKRTTGGERRRTAALSPEEHASSGLLDLAHGLHLVVMRETAKQTRMTWTSTSW
jgi:hypothetical protein